MAEQKLIRQNNTFNSLYTFFVVWTRATTDYEFRLIPSETNIWIKVLQQYRELNHNKPTINQGNVYKQSAYSPHNESSNESRQNQMSFWIN